ncbi:MAG TPA: N-6 DNA methylase, partial [Dehalococcoidia bacterium]|nr:N-6 DNA methylase [Dehalococcoidia bacterium]
MARPARHQRLPSAGPEREALREKGQFWTPSWVAEAMVGYVLHGGADHLFDPAVGAGAFFHAAKALGRQVGRQIALFGAEIDPEAMRQAAETGLTADDLAAVEMRSFVLHPPRRTFRAIAANPPYIRHHRLPITLKAELKAYGASVIGTPLDGRAGLHVYFLLRALQQLDAGGRLAFIMPADTCEGTFAPALWAWITHHYRLDAVVTFAPEATPFPGVDTNALIFLIQRDTPADSFLWARCTEAGTRNLAMWTCSGFGHVPDGALEVHHRLIHEALRTGLSRPPITDAEAHEGPILADFATVMRGIATGANDFFFLTRERAHALGIPDAFLRDAIGRTRDVAEPEVTAATLRRLEAAGRPTRLLSLDGRPVEGFPAAVREYLRRGEDMGLPGKALISQRKPWYKMESRPVPPFLFAYLGRRNARFIRNSAGVLPLTGFLCVYPRSQDPAVIEKLWRVLRHP